MVSLFTDENLDMWIRLKRNVLLTGKHGVGKTTKIISAFNRANINWKYFSASTMDPWTDFVGVPRVKLHDSEEYLEYVLPKIIAEDKIQAFFFDEFNRSPKRVRNAVMELIQFKSINGKKLNSLQMVWAARNPEDEEDAYDVECMDRAQVDRFQIQCDVPYCVDVSYFASKYGQEVAEAAYEWWMKLDDKHQNMVSPRKLDDALAFYQEGGDLSHVLSPKLNVSSLRVRLNFGAYTKQFKKILDENNPEAIKNFLIAENNYSGVIDDILKQPNQLFVLEYVPKDKLSNLIRHDSTAYNHVIENYENKVFGSVIDSIIEIGGATKNDKFVKKLEKDILAKNPNHAVSENTVKRNFIVKLKQHRKLNDTFNRRKAVTLLSEAQNVNLDLANFSRSDFGFIVQYMSEIADSTQKRPLAKWRDYWRVLDFVLRQHLKSENLVTSSLTEVMLLLRTTYPDQNWFSKIADWCPMTEFGWEE